MVLYITVAIFLTVALLILFVDIESVNRREAEPDKEPQATDIRSRSAARRRAPAGQ